MLLGGDLGFSCLVLVVVLFGPVIGFVVRRKWRLAVARSEEIKRLLVLASEEAARAELEAYTGYITPGSNTGQLQYQCAVCFCATTTRCARCKAVRYCSGKCQIIHWRQGHKEECYPYTGTDQINDVGGSFIQKAFKQEENEIYGNSFETEGRQFTKPVEAVPEEPAFSNSSCSPAVVCEKDDIKIECLADGKGTNFTSEFTNPSLSNRFSSCSTSSESFVDVAINRVSSSHHPERLDGHHSTNNIPDKVGTTDANCMDQTRPPTSEYPTLVNSVDNFTSSGKLNQIKPDCNDGDTHCGSTSSPGWTVDGSNESSISEPSTPSSGFWEGTIETDRCRDDVLDDSAQYSSSDGSISHFQSSLGFSFKLDGDVVPPLNVQSSDAKTIISDACPTTLGIKKPIDGATLSKETSTDATMARSLPSLISEMPYCIDSDTSSESCILKSREIFSSSVSHDNAASSTGGHSIKKDASDVSSLPSLSTERSNFLVNGMSNTSHLSKSKEVGSSSFRASDAHLSSSSGIHSVMSAKSGKVDGTHAVAADSSQLASSPNASNGLKTSVQNFVDQFRSSNLSRHYPLGVGSEIAGRYINKGLFPYERFVKLYNWKEVELHPCGLLNCGNSCYANAVLQCLAFTVPLTAYLLQGLHSRSCEKKGRCFTCEFESLILKVKEGNSPASPIGILSQIQKTGSPLGNGKEEDAHEFLRYAIDTMQSICLKEAGVKASGTLEEETTLIGLTFGGYLRSKIKCTKCGSKSERHERMMDLTVEIGGDIGTLEEALKQFTRTEILDGENKYQCSRCKSYERAKKKLTVSETPNILTIALKRFQSGKFGKLNKAIRFPEILDLAPYVSGTSDKSPIYRLYGVVVHLDNMNAAFSGHYVCYVKNIQNKWFKIDDSTVKAVELERVLTKGAYMLLYARCSPRAPRLIRNSIIPHDPRKPKTPAFKLRPNLPDPRYVSRRDHLSAQATIEPFYTNLRSFQRIQTVFEEDSSSDNSSVGFSEEGSSSTESTRGSTSTDDSMDQIFGDVGYNWNSPCRNSSDSDTSSSSSSSPSPLSSRHSPLADLDRYSSGFPETSGTYIDNVGSTVKDHGLRARPPGRSSKTETLEGEGGLPSLYSDTTKHCRKLVGSSRETDWDRLGRLNPLDNIKAGVSFRRSTWERTE